MYSCRIDIGGGLLEYMLSVQTLNGGFVVFL